MKAVIPVIVSILVNMLVVGIELATGYNLALAPRLMITVPMVVAASIWTMDKWGV